MAVLQLHNSLGNQKQVFEPLDPAHIRVYACGPTVYDYAHIGNARMAVAFDLLVRVLRVLYPKVTYVSNITDIDDKIIKAAAERGAPINEITAKFTAIYNQDMAALGAALPDVQPRATEHIDDMIALIGVLVQAGHAYAKDGHVLFNVPSFPAYGTLSGRSRDEQVAGARVEVAPYKQDPADFILWKPSTGDQPGWDSPWGFGRPGWHIECSAMAERHLGLPFDIHGGGADLKFPHHENEIAQSCCAHGHENEPKSFAKYWVHNGFVTVSGEKMAKSVGNITLAHQLLADHPGEVLRLALLSAHYRQPLDWSESLLHQTKSQLDRFYRILKDLEDVPVDENISNPEILEALCDDLNTPKAIAVLNAIAKKAVSEKSSLWKTALLKGGQSLGVLNKTPDEWLGLGAAGYSDELKETIEKLLAERQKAKTEKRFDVADSIREELHQMGIAIEDTPEGPKWRQAN